MKFSTSVKLMVTAILAMLLFVPQSSTAEVVEYVELQGPDVSRNATARIGYAEGSNYGGASIRIKDRYQHWAAIGLLDFDLDDYIGGLPVQNAEISAWHYSTGRGEGVRNEFELRPFTKSWIANEATAIHRKADTEWNRGESWIENAYITGRDEDGNYLNFTDEILAESYVAGPDHEDSTMDTWRTLSGEALDDYLNEVIAGEREHYGFVLWNNPTRWATDTEAYLYGTEYEDDPSLRPKMTFEVIPEPSTLALLGLAGLLLLKRRRLQ